MNCTWGILSSQKLRSKVRDKRESLLKCPKCEATMVRNFYTMAYLIEVDRCSFCNHVWFDKDELEMVQYLIENKKSANLVGQKAGVRR